MTDPALFDSLWTGATPMEDWTRAVAAGQLTRVTDDIVTYHSTYFCGSVTAISASKASSEGPIGAAPNRSMVCDVSSRNSSISAHSTQSIPRATVFSSAGCANTLENSGNQKYLQQVT